MEKCNLKQVGEEQAPPLTLAGPNTRPLANPSGAMTVELAAIVSSGKMKPREAEFLKYDKLDEATAKTSEGESDADSEYGSDYDSGDESEYSLDEGEMADILNSMTLPTGRPITA